MSPTSYQTALLRHYSIIINYNLKLQDDINLFVADSTMGNKYLKAASEKKYTFIVFYAEWAGFYSDDVLKKILKHVKEREVDLQLIYVNTAIRP